MRRFRLTIAMSMAMAGTFHATGCQFGVEGGTSALSTRFGGIATATAVSPSSVAITWLPQAGYTSYAVYSSSQNTPLATLTTGNSYTVNGLSANTSYSFSVVGTSADGNQFGVAHQVQATTWTNFLGPTSAQQVDSQSIALLWNYNAGPVYNVYYQAGSAPTIAAGSFPKLIAPQLTTTSQTGITVSGLQPNTTYYFMVAAKYSDGTDSYQNALAVSGATTSKYITTGTLTQLPEISSAALLASDVAPVFQVSGGLASYQTSFGILSDPLLNLGSTSGNGAFTAAHTLPVGTQTVIATITNPLLPGLTAKAEIGPLTVVPALPNNGLKVVNATTTSGLSPIPTISVNPVSLGPYPVFTVSGAQPGYVTTIYNPATTPATPLGTVTGNGQIKTVTSSPLPPGLNTLYAVVNYNGVSATINNVQVRIRSVDNNIIAQPVGVNGGVGTQGFGHNLAVGDFNCDGRPDLAVSAPYGNGVFVYYGSASGLDFSSSPSTTPTGTKPLYIPVPYPAAWLGYPSAGQSGGGLAFGAQLAAGNFNGDYNVVPTKPCSDLAISAAGAFGSYGGGTVTVYYGAPTGLQTALPSLPQENSLTCVGGGSNSCDPAYFSWWKMGYSFGPHQDIPWYSPGIGWAMAVGDVDGDGYDDIVATNPNGSGYSGGPDGNMGGEAVLWRGTANGISPNFTPIKFPAVLSQNSDGVSQTLAQFGYNVTIGHFITSARGSGGPADIAFSFARLSPDATGVGITNPTTQSGVIVVPGSAAPPYVAVDGSNYVNSYYLITPPNCNTASTTLPAGWNPYGAQCGSRPNTLMSMDVNKDTYDDIIFSDPYIATPGGRAGAVYVYWGGSNAGSFITQGSQSTIPSPGNTCAGQPCSTPQVFYRSDTGIAGFGTSLGYVGDINHDGYPDLGIGASNTTVSGRLNAGTAYIYHGSATGLTTSFSSTINANKPVNAFFGSSIIGAKFSDTNGFANLQNLASTYNDVVVGAIGESPANRTNGIVAPTGTGPAGSQAHGTASLYVNSTGLSTSLTTPNTVIAPATTPLSTLGAEHAVLAGDLNGDGYGDAVIRVVVPGPFTYNNASPLVTSQIGFVVYYGSPSGFITTTTSGGVTTLIAPSYNPVHTTDPLFVTNTLLNGGANFSDPNFAYEIVAAGDVNGDGYGDFVTTDQGGYSSVLFYGSPSGLIVSPYPKKKPFDSANRPSLDPTIIADNYYVIGGGADSGDGYGGVQGQTWGSARTFGDFNGDGYSDIAFSSTSGITVIYGSAWGIVSDGDVYDVLNAPGPSYTAAPNTNRVSSTPNCMTGTPNYCTPVGIIAAYGAANTGAYGNNVGYTSGPLNPGACGIMNGGDMDGDGSDDLVSDNCLDTTWNPGAGTVSIYYGSKTNGINPSIFVNLRIDPAVGSTQRYLGGPDYAWTPAFTGGFGRGYDLNGDGLSDILFTSSIENTAYVIYGVPGPGTSPTTNSGAYIQQGLCAGGTYPCRVNVTTVATPDYRPEHVMDVSNSNPSSCSPALRSCNVLRFVSPTGLSCYQRSGFFGLGDITGDTFGDAVLSTPCYVDPSIPFDGANVWGTFYIYSGSANGLQVAGTPSTNPNCVNGICDPTQFTIPASLAQMPNPWPDYQAWYANNTQNPTDVDGDGHRDFLIVSPGMNSVDSNGNTTGTQIGGFFLFH